MEFYIGQKLYREKYNRDFERDIEEVAVAKIGKKYLYTDKWADGFPINKQNLKYENKEYSQSNFQLYTDKQQIFDKREGELLFNAISQKFNNWKSRHHISLEQLRSVSEILGITKQGE